MTAPVFEHHRATIDRAVARLRTRDDVLAVLVGGSIAHGFATETSDVDLLIVVSDADWDRRLAAGDTTLLDQESATYEGGYVDCKYTSVGFMREVAARGTEQARFAFDGVDIAWSRIDGLDDALRDAARYPIEGRDDRDPGVPRAARVLALDVPRIGPRRQRVHASPRRAQRRVVRAGA